MHVIIPKPRTLLSDMLYLMHVVIPKPRTLLGDNALAAAGLRCHDATSADELTLLAYLNISMRLNTSAPMPS